MSQGTKKTKLEVNLYPLHRAAEKGDYNKVDSLLKEGVKINKLDRNGHTALFVAIASLEIDLATLLIERGADVNAGSKEHETPFFLALGFGDSDLVQLFLENGVILNDEFKESYLSLVLKFRSVNPDLYDKIGIELVNLGTDLNELDEDHRDPFIQAVYRNSYVLAKLIFQKNKTLDLNLKDNDGYTALYYAIRKNNSEIVKMIIDRLTIPEEIDEFPVVMSNVFDGKTYLEIAGIVKVKNISKIISDGYKKYNDRLITMLLISRKRDEEVLFHKEALPLEIFNVILEMSGLPRVEEKEHVNKNYEYDPDYDPNRN